MTSESLPSRFYRIVYFSPRPEDGERVCVALIIWDEGRTYFLFDRNARKARGLSRSMARMSSYSCLSNWRKRLRKSR